MRFGGAIFGGGGGTTPNGQPWVLVASDTAPQRVKDIADYICDNVADDVQIQSALDDVSGGGTVKLSQGVFTIAATLEIGGSHIVLSGDKGTLLQGPGDTVTPFIRTDDTTIRTNLLFENIIFDSTVAGSGLCIHMEDIIDSEIRNCRFTDFLTSLHFEDADGIRNLISACFFRGVGVGSCILMDGAAANDNTFVSCSFNGDSDQSSVILIAARMNRFYGCFFNGSSVGLNLDATSHNTLCSGCWFEGATTGILMASGVETPTFICCQILLNTTNITDNGADAPQFLGCRLEQVSFNELRNIDGTYEQIVLESSQINNGVPAAGQITVTKPLHSVNTGGGAQIVDEALTPSLGRILILRASSSSNDLTITSSSGVVGEFILTGDASCVLANARDTLTVIGINGLQWVEISRSITGL